MRDSGAAEYRIRIGDLNNDTNYGVNGDLFLGAHPLKP